MADFEGATIIEERAAKTKLPKFEAMVSLSALPVTIVFESPMSCNNQIPYRNSQTLVVESPSPKSVEVAYFMAPLDDERKDCDTFLMALA